MPAGEQDVVVLGAGVAGLATAALLAHRGLRVVVVEKNTVVGGACATVSRGDYRVDVGTHVFTRGDRGPLGEVLRRTGNRARIDFVATDPLIEYDVLGERLVLKNHRADLARLWWSLCRAVEAPLRDVARTSAIAAQAAILSDAQCEALDALPLTAYLDRMTHHPALRLWIAYLLTTFFVVSPSEASTGESLWCMKRILREFAIGYPRGGSAAIPDAYRRTAEAYGARVLLGTRAARIDVSDGRVAGVTLEDGTTLRAPTVVAAFARRSALVDLIPSEYLPDDLVKRTSGIRGSHYGIQLKLALDTRAMSTGFLMGLLRTPRLSGPVTAATLNDVFVAVANGRLPPVNMLTAVAQTNFDPSLAPPGVQLVSVAMLAPNGAVTLQDEDGEAAWLRELERSTDVLLPGWRAHVLWREVMYVREIEQWGGRPGGGLVSTGQTVDQVGRLRPGVRGPLEGLYLAGDGTGRHGVGTELAVASAFEVADAIRART